MTPPPSPAPWRRVASTPGLELEVLRARLDDFEHPRTGTRHQRVVVESSDWANVVAVTAERELVVVRQFRFGLGRVTLEIPGGIVDPGESPAEAARRELLEETGFAGERWTSLGSVAVNPAFLTNRCHHFLLEDARRVAEPTPDAGEDLAVGTLPLERVPALVASGELEHSLVLSALARVLPLWPMRLGG